MRKRDYSFDVGFNVSVVCRVGSVEEEERFDSIPVEATNEESTHANQHDQKKS